MKISDLDDMQLPKSSANSQLEELSYQKLLSKFPHDKFLPIKEDKDKGLDATFELIKNGLHTGFRFLIQLKATQSIKPNSDGSYSWQIEISNIQYLLNQGKLAYYVLYVKEQDQLYLISIGEVVALLSGKNSEWDKQDSHAIRFSVQLNKEEVEKLYIDTLQHGIMQRNINVKLALSTSTKESYTNFIVDSKLNVHGEEEILKFVEKWGIKLLNDGQWRKIIELNLQLVRGKQTPPFYNMIVGIAHYYSGSRFDALSYFKQAVTNEKQIPEEYRDLLKYMDNANRFSIGLVSFEEYQKLNSTLKDTPIVGKYLLLEKLRSEYFQGLHQEKADAYEVYANELNKLIDDPNTPHEVYLLAQSDALLYGGMEENLFWINEVLVLNGKEKQNGIDIIYRMELEKYFINTKKQWREAAAFIRKAAVDNGNLFTHYTVLLNELKVEYQFTIIMVLVRPVMLNSKAEEDAKASNEILENILKALKEALAYFRQVNHVDNIVASLYSIYEILDFLKMEEAKKEVESEMNSIISTYDLKQHQTKWTNTAAMGTFHQSVLNIKADIEKLIEKNVEEYRSLISAINEMDKAEMGNTDQLKDCHNIELFPLGYFKFPKTSKRDVFEILGVTDTKLIEQFSWMFEELVPIANTFNYPLLREGLDLKNEPPPGMDGIRNMHRVRKAFFERGFRKFEINFGRNPK